MRWYDYFKPKNKVTNMDVIHITDSNEQVLYGLNFTNREFWHPIIAPADKDFNLFVCIPLALQVIRDFFTKQYGREIAILITSTYRPFDPITMPPAHKVPPPAVDSVALDETLREEIINKIRLEFKRWEQSELVAGILKTGCNVMIIENTCLHLHYRENNLNYHPEYTPQHFYIGEWQPSKTNPMGINVCYSV